MLTLALICTFIAGGWLLNRSMNNNENLQQHSDELEKQVDELEEQVKQSLNILDGCYRDIGKVLEMPVFFDDPIVKQTLNSIKRAREAILRVANKLANSFSSSEVTDVEKGTFER